MAKVLNTQKSLNSAFTKRAGIGLGFACIGGILIVIFHQVPVGIILVIAGLCLISRGNKFLIGAVGESHVAEVRSRFPDDWYIFNDMIVGRSQIDYIVICPKGLYTIETKNYQGTIYGNAEKQKWSQVINYKYKSQFYNPVKQGTGHSVALSNYLKSGGFNRIWVNTIVVFTEPSSKLKVYSPKVPVIPLSNLSKFFNNQRQVMNPDECTKIAKYVHKLIDVKN